MEQQNLFIEQAEYIDDEFFVKWTTEHPNEKSIIRKLSQAGAKLIIGPRGCGKTTLMLKTRNILLRDKGKTTSLPVYVNFKSSLKLEPLYKKNANAAFWFNQWILFKIYQGIYETLNNIKGINNPNLVVDINYVNKITSYMEMGKTDLYLPDEKLLTIPILEADISKILEYLELNRCVLLLDDAAHAFSTEQQRDFFDFFRRVKSKIISPKAAIYPGVTTFSSTFHLGHDAEEIDVWIKPDSTDYLKFMLSLLENRLPPNVFNTLQTDLKLLELICYSSFGVPRALLNMIRNFYKEIDSDSDKYEVTFTRKKGLTIIKESFENSWNIYLSLQDKIPIYKKFITNGNIIFDNILSFLKEFNKGKGLDNQTVLIAIKNPIPSELSKVLGFFQYSGLILPKGVMSRGDVGTFETYMIHYTALISRNVLIGKTKVNISEYSHVFSSPNPKLYRRVNPNILANTNDFSEDFPLSLPPCQVCQSPRVREDAKFCLNCGSQLKTASIFEELVKKDIEALPLTKRRIVRIKEFSTIRTIKDILMDHENRELRKVPQIGPYWAKRIFSYAEEFIA